MKCSLSQLATAGVFFGLYGFEQQWDPFLVTVGVGVGLALLVFKRPRLFLLVILASLMFFRLIQWQNQVEKLSFQEGVSYRWKLQIKKLAYHSAGKRLYPCRVLRGPNPLWREATVLLELPAEKLQELSLYDEIELESPLASLKDPLTPYSFSWKKVLRYDRVLYSLRSDRILKVSSSSSWWLRSSSQLRKRCIKRIADRLEPESKELVLGILLGSTRFLSREHQVQARLTGVTHLMPASGSNVLLILGLWHYATKFWWKRGVEFRWILGMTLVLFYSFMIANPIPMVRALVASVIAMIFYAWGACFSLRDAILWTLVLSVLWDPGLWWNVGFVMSVLACWGVVIGLEVSELVSKKYSSFLVEPLLVGLSVHLMLWPYNGSSFGSFSWLGVWVNLLAVPLSEVIITLSPLVLLFDAVWIDQILNGLCSLFWWILEAFSFKELEQSCLNLPLWWNLLVWPWGLSMFAKGFRYPWVWPVFALLGVLVYSPLLASESLEVVEFSLSRGREGVAFRLKDRVWIFSSKKEIPFKVKAFLRGGREIRYLPLDQERKISWRKLHFEVICREGEFSCRFKNRRFLWSDDRGWERGVFYHKVDGI